MDRYVHGDNNINMFGIGADLGCTLSMLMTRYILISVFYANFIIEGISEELYGERYSNSVQGFQCLLLEV